MAGAYCRYCGHRCFVLRVLPDFSWSGHLATCAKGMAHDRNSLGYDHTTALNLIAPIPNGLHLRQVGDDDIWQIVHTASDLHIPLLDWPHQGVPRDAAEVAAASLATSGIDWTRDKTDLAEDIKQVIEAARVASTAAYDFAVHIDAQVDERSGPHRLEARRAAARRARLTAL
jgi:hypothetical protein